MAILQSDGVNHTSDLILRRNGTEGLRLTSSTVQVSSINDGPLAGFRNAIINGNFDIWQRGTSFTNPLSGSGFTADRWLPAHNGTGATRVISRQAFALGQTDVPGEPTYHLRWNQSAAGSGGTFNDILQRIEGVRSFAGQTVTLSFYAKAAAATTLTNANYLQNFGTGGSPSATVQNTISTNLALTTVWQKFSYSFSVPSISGKVLGSDGNDSLTIAIRMPLNATFTVDIAQVQVEAGPVATPFERRPIGTELALCQRYFCNTRASHRFWSVIGTQVGEVQAYWPMTMRKDPSVTITAASRNNINLIEANDPNIFGTRYTVVALSANLDTFGLNDLLSASAEL
jgi:hypothetical protein